MRGHSGSRRRRLLALLGACGALAAATGLLATSAAAAGTTINVFYTSPTSIQVSLSDGTAVAAGSTIPAGSYQVLVYDNNNYDTSPKFTMSGPGVSIPANNLNSTGMGIDLPTTFGPFSFQTSSSYTVSDPGIGASVTFQTSATSSGSELGRLDRRRLDLGRLDLGRLDLGRLDLGRLQRGRFRLGRLVGLAEAARHRRGVGQRLGQADAGLRRQDGQVAEGGPLHDQGRRSREPRPGCSSARGRRARSCSAPRRRSASARRRSRSAPASGSSSRPPTARRPTSASSPERPQRRRGPAAKP